MNQLTIVSRRSPLAIRQAQLVAKRIEDALHICCRILTVTTQADRHIDRSLSDFGGKGLFVKELERALIDQRADIAVHSLKDVPGELPEAFALAAVLKRDHPGDVLLMRQPPQGWHQAEQLGRFNLKSLPKNWRIGTSSTRRKYQLLNLQPEWTIQPLRGNINTRMRLLTERQLDGIVLARAGLDRMSEASSDEWSFAALAQQGRALALSISESLPCPAQGALCIECLSQRDDLLRCLSTLTHPPTAVCVRAERELSRRFGADCHTSFAAYATLDDTSFRLTGLVSAPGKRVARGHGRITFSDHTSAEVVEQAGLTVVDRVYRDMVELGAVDLLRAST